MRLDLTLEVLQENVSPYWLKMLPKYTWIVEPSSIILLHYRSCASIKYHTLKDRVCMVQTIALHHTLLHCRAEADQFIEGFKVLGVLSAITEHCNLLMPFYTNKTTKLTPGNAIILYNNN